MKTEQILNVLMGAVLIAFAGYFYVEGKVPGHGRATSMTRETHPAIFWTVNLLIASSGAVLMFYGIARTFNFARGFTTRMDGVAKRFSLLTGRNDRGSPAKPRSDNGKDA